MQLYEDFDFQIHISVVQPLLGHTSAMGLHNAMTTLCTDSTETGRGPETLLCLMPFPSCCAFKSAMSFSPSTHLPFIRLRSILPQSKAEPFVAVSFNPVNQCKAEVVEAFLTKFKLLQPRTRALEWSLAGLAAELY